MDNQKLCECGCGAPTSVIKKSSKNRGLVRGQYRRFLRGHQRRLVQPTLAGILANTKLSDTGCLEWQGCTNAKGYGSGRAGGRTGLVHRFVYRLAHGEIPEGGVVRHKCDNPRCVNPEHLICGTQADNVADKVERGRTSSVLTEAQVVDILSSDETGKTLALLYGVSAANISCIRLRKSWKHVLRGAI